MFKRFVFIFLRLVFRVFPRKPLVTAQIQKLVVIKLCCIGDILFTTPLLRALAKNFPRLRMSYMVTGWCRELAAADPRVSATIEFNAYDAKNLLEKIRRSLLAMRDLRAGKFDAAIILHRSPLAGVLAALAGIPIRIGFDWEGEGFAHTHPVPFRTQAHEVDRNLDCLKPLDASADGTAPELTPPAKAREMATAFLKQQGWQAGTAPLVAIFPAGGVNPGTTMATKRWHLEGYRAVCRELQEKYQAGLILIGSQSDAAVGDELAAKEKWPGLVMRAEGRTSLLELAALLEQCTLFIGGDSGPLHIADAVGLPTVSIFGPTDPMLLSPRGPRHRVIRRVIPCAPCYNPVTVRQSDVTVCREGTHACMREITAAEVLAAAQELLLLKGYVQA